ncbi:MAG TPA: UDP-N-acetylglucosamine 4,6-dehydratase (inverting) [Phycisphaerae bacterium]|nr:UDP-N-acetylglucosamine 4,6-dehydratase (inverting) [Phycisphaerae bacterium]
MLNGKTILITGGTGSFGRKTVETLLTRYKLNKLIIFSRDELKQFEMSQVFSPQEHNCLRYFLGDVRDKERLNEAFYRVDYVIHAAAIKQVPAAEYNPFETVLTNVIGAQNIIRAAIQQGVKKVMALSTDKATAPCNLYGATKLCSDKLFIAGNAMSGLHGSIFAVVRYGNVLGSRGSVIPFFLARRKEGVFPITDERMTRFSITLDRAVDFVLQCLDNMYGGELFVPKIPSYRIMDVVRSISPEARIEVIGIRPGEKLHECLITEDDARQSLEFDDHFIMQPNFGWWDKESHLVKSKGRPCPEGFSYTSVNNTEWLDVEDIRAMINGYCQDHGLESV